MQNNLIFNYHVSGNKVIGKKVHNPERGDMYKNTTKKLTKTWWRPKVITVEISSSPLPHLQGKKSSSTLLRL